MSLLGIDVGTTGCKASVFSVEGAPLASAYREYDIQRPQSGWAQLDTAQVWDKVCTVIAAAAAAARNDPVSALSVSSLGEAMAPVSANREILGPSLLNADERGAAYLPALARSIDPARLYAINGNTLGNHYSLTKLLWTREHAPDLYDRTHLFLHWGAFVSFMLGAEPVVDFSLANRTLLFDVNRGTWSEELLAWAGLERAKLPETAPSGTVIGRVSNAMARTLGLSPTTAIVTGAHDQCANAAGCGALEPGHAMLGMGTVLCAVPVYTRRPEPDVMIPRGLNTEHHAAPGRYVSFIYNQGGCLVKWFRDTFARTEHANAQAARRDVYPDLIAEIPREPARVLVLPHFAPTGPPEFISDSSGVIAGLHLDTTRGEILKGILEGALFYLKESLDGLPAAGIGVTELRAVGGGSQSDAWLETAADVLGVPLVRTALHEAGALGGAILAGAATGVFASIEEGAQTMVKLTHTFHPDPARAAAYAPRYQAYTQLGPLLRNYLRGLNAG